MRSLFGRQVTPDGRAGAQRLRDRFGHFDRRSSRDARAVVSRPEIAWLSLVPLLQ